MKKLILVKSNETYELDSLMNQGWDIIDFKPVSQHVSITGRSERRETGNIYAYVLLEKIEVEKRERIPLNG